MMTWKGTWDQTIQYAQGDVVAYHGSSYIAVTLTPTKGQPPSTDSQDWNLVAQAGSPGLVWRGIWQDTDYQVDDAVNYAGSSYIAISNISKGSQPPPESPNLWEVLAAQGFLHIKWCGDWDPQTIYQLSDAVRYQQDVYASLLNDNQNHRPDDQAYWQNITQYANTQAMDIASIIMSSLTAIGTIAMAIMDCKNSVNDAITAAAAAANGALTAANLAQEAVNAAKKDISSLKDDVDTAQQTADSANRTANAAQDTAEAASREASVARDTAEAAQGFAQDGLRETRQIGENAVTAFDDIQSSINNILDGLEILYPRISANS